MHPRPSLAAILVVAFAQMCLGCGGAPGDAVPGDVDPVTGDGGVPTDGGTSGGGKDAGVPTPDAGTSRPPLSARWSYTSPPGMRQLPEEDEATTASIRIGLRGWDQIANARTLDGSATLQVVPRSGARSPRRILTETANTRTLYWMLTPLGHLWHNPILWNDGAMDTGRVLYHVLEPGVLNTTWTAAPAGSALTVVLSAVPTPISAGVYRLGALRVRVVAGTSSVSGTVLTVTPAAGRAQLLVYSDTHYDLAAVNAAGALLTPASGRVAVRATPVTQKHLHFKSTVLGIDTVFALGDGSPRTVGPIPVLYADHAVLVVGTPLTTMGWRIGSLAAKIIKSSSGQIGMRRMYYANAEPAAGYAVGGQTFNFYVFSPRGTITLWTVGRVVEPYRVSAFDGPPAVTLTDFPATENDYSEDLATGRNVMRTRTAWAWDSAALVEGSSMRAAVALAHTGMQGNSIDGGWRHIARGPTIPTFQVGSASGFSSITVPANAAYRYDFADSALATFPSFSVFHRLRSWTGAWATRQDRLASLRSGDGTYFGHMKALTNTDVLPAGSTFDVNQVIRVAPGPSEAAATLRARYAFPTGTRLRRGMLDLDAGATPTTAWDLGIRGETASIVYR
jgi:hypothetical protein